MKLTLPQQDIYFEQFLYPNEPIYNIGAKIIIEGIIDVKALQNAYTLLIDQHDAYRSIFVQGQEDITVRVLEHHNTELELMDFSNLEKSDEMANDFIQKEFLKPFDILNGSILHRFILIKVDPRLHYLFSVYHHIITDGWGTSLMFQRLVTNYNEILEFGKVVCRYPFSYRDFVIDDEAYRVSKAFEDDKSYWTGKFKSLPENLFEKIAPNGQQNRSSRKVLNIKRTLYDQLQRYAEDQKSSAFHLILAVLYLYFGRRYQNKDFAIGLPVLNRSKSTFKKTVGLFMGVSPLRIQLDFENTFQDLIVSIKTQLREDYRHQRFPLGKLIQKLQVFHEKERLFNITLSYEKQNYANHFAGTKTTVIPLTHQSERVALAIYIREFDEQEDVKIDFDYNLNYFDQESISQIAMHFENLLRNAIEHPKKKLKELKYLARTEEEQLILGFNYTTTPYARDNTFLSFFKIQAQEKPENIAVFDTNRKYTYAALDLLSDQIAAYILKIDGISNTATVGVALERSATAVAILLGVLKAGKAYIPLDPTFPEERLRYIIQHSGLKTLISDKQLADPDVPQLKLVAVDNLLKECRTLGGEVGMQASATDTAYVIYTSGSTGNPKGVEIGHRSLLNFLLSMQKKLDIQHTDCLFAVTTYSFDISILEFFVPLISGASVFIADHITLNEPQRTIEAIEKVDPSIIQATPSFYQLLFNAGWSGGRTLKILCGGDLLSEDLAENLLNTCGELWNMYGPTETTIWSSLKQITSRKEAANIGVPIANTQFYILDEFKQLLPVGASGVLYIGGDGLAKGYFKADDLTQQKFIVNPFMPGALVYNTNDLAKWNSKGEVEFLGRNDNQVKIRGYRIELGEIETKINLMPEIKQAVVVAKKHKNQEAFLVAYVIKEIDEFDTQNVITYLQRELPSYMIPYAIITLESFPLTPNKKVDRKVLVNKEIGSNREDSSFKHAESTLEKRLVRHWKNVLHVEKEISILDNFFTLGGHSLNAVKLIHLINDELFYTIDLKAIFNYPTIESLAKYLSTIDPGGGIKIPKAQVKEYYRITPSQYEIWLASQQKNRCVAYNMVAAFHIDGRINVGQIESVLHRMIAEHEILRTNFVEINGIVFQKINAESSSSFSVGLCKVEEGDVGPILSKYIHEEFDLAKDLLIRMKVLQTEEDSSILVFCTHHIIMDGGSLEHFIKSFLIYYNQVSAVHQAPDRLYDKPGFQFKDYSEWMTSSINTSTALSFWESNLAGYQVKESFVPDRVHATESYAGSQFNFKLNAKETQALKVAVQRQKTTAHNFFAAALVVLIYRISGHGDICLGTVNSGRNVSELDEAIGMFVKMLPLRTTVNGEQTFASILEKIERGVLQINDHQEIPELMARKTLFDTLLVFQNPDFSYQNVIQMDDSKLTIYPIDLHFSRLPILINIFQADDEFNVVISYNSEKYDAETIQIIFLKYLQAIRELMADPYLKVDDIDVSLPFEKLETVDINFNF